MKATGIGCVKFGVNGDEHEKSENCFRATPKFTDDQKSIFEVLQKENQIDLRNQGENPCRKYRVIGCRRVGVKGDKKEKCNISPDRGRKIHQEWEKYGENNAAVEKVAR